MRLIYADYNPYTNSIDVNTFENYILRIAAFCGLSFLLAIKITSKLSNYILHQFEGLHKLWDTPVVSVISKNVIKYAEELGLGNKETIPASYLFTSNLKELSGAVLHKTAFAFRLAYITVIEDTLKIKLPIILDSPSGKEVDQANIKLMMDILKRDFADHQIIIASIFNYDFDEAKIIEIKERLITENSL